MAVPARLTAREGRRFAFTVGIAFVALGAISAWRGHYLPPRILWALGGVLLAAGLFVPSRLGGVYRGWMGLAHAIAKVTGPVALGAAYFVVLTPIAGLMRLFGSNPLRHQERDGSFWISAQSEGRSNLETQF